MADETFSISSIISLGVSLIIWYFISKDWLLEMSTFWAGCIFFFLVWTGAKYPVWRSRYFSCSFSCDGAAGSFSHNHSPLKIPDAYVDSSGSLINFNWLVYGLGSHNFPMEVRGKLETVCVPDFQVNEKFKNHQSFTKVQCVPLQQIPFSNLRLGLQRYEDILNLDKVKFGYRMTDFKFSSADDLALDALLASQSQQAAQFKDIADGNNDQLEEHLNKLNRANGRKSWISALGDMMKRSPTADSEGM